jgi:branched-chain amino acid transport system permease protein
MRLKRLAVLGGLALGLVVVPLALRESPYLLGVLTTASVLSLLSLGVWLTFAIGRINIGQAAFALIGGYVTAILSVKGGVSFWLCLPLSGLAAALVGAAIGWPILRLKGVYFAMITLSLTEAARLAALNGGTITQGASGILNVPMPEAVSLFGIVLVPAFRTLNAHLAFYYLAAALLILGLLTVRRIATCRLGWIFRALRQDEALAASIGVDVAKYRVVAFAIGCFFAGIAGAFFTVSQQSIYPSSFGVPDSIYFMLYCFLGGLAYVSGPVVGAFVLFLSFELLHGLREYQMLAYAAIMIAVMLWLPNGLLSLRPPGRLVAAMAARRPGRRPDAAGRPAGVKAGRP